MVGKIPLEKEMATYSSILTWEILWTEEPGGLQSTGLQTVRHTYTTCLQINWDIYFFFNKLDVQQVCKMHLSVLIVHPKR